MLFSKPLETDTRGESICAVVRKYATDGPPSMIGRHCGFIAHLKRALPNIFSIHCVIHRQHLIAKHLTVDLYQKKKNALNDRIFSYFVITMTKITSASFFTLKLGGFLLSSSLKNMIQLWQKRLN